MRNKGNGLNKSNITKTGIYMLSIINSSRTSGVQPMAFVRKSILAKGLLLASRATIAHSQSKLVKLQAFIHVLSN